MIRVDIPEHSVTADFPDDMPEWEIKNVIESQFYGAPSIGPTEPAETPYTLTPEDVGKAQVELAAKQEGVPLKEFREQPGLQRWEELGNSFISGAMGTGEGLLGSLEWISGSEKARDLANQASRWSEEHAPVDPSLVDEVAAGFGSTATFFIPGMGVAAGAGKLATVAPRVATWIGIGVASVMEAGAEAGISYRESMKATGDEAKSSKAAGTTFWANMTLIPITNKLGIFGEKGKAIRKSLMSAGMEATQEGFQHGISEAAKESGLTEAEFYKKMGLEAVGPEGRKAALIGGIVGGSMTAVGHAMPQPTAPEGPGIPPPAAEFVPPEEPLRDPRGPIFAGREEVPGAEREAPRREGPRPGPRPGPEMQEDLGLAPMEPTVQERVTAEVPGLREKTLAVIEEEFGVGSPEAEEQRKVLGLPPAPPPPPPVAPPPGPPMGERKPIEGKKAAEYLDRAFSDRELPEGLSLQERRLAPENVDNIIAAAMEGRYMNLTPEQVVSGARYNQQEAQEAVNEATRRGEDLPKPLVDLDLYKQIAEGIEQRLAGKKAAVKKGRKPRAKTAKSTPPPGTPKQKDVKGDPMPAGEITPKKQKTYLLDAIDNAIQEAPQGLAGEIVHKTIELDTKDSKGVKDSTQVVDMEKTPTVRIKVPGDGIFTVINEVERLKAFRDKVKTNFPAAPAKATGVSMGPSTKQAPRRVAETLRGEDDLFELEYASVYIPRKFASLYPKENNKQWAKGYLQESAEWISNGAYIVLKPDGFKIPAADKAAEVQPLPKGYEDVLKVKNTEKAEIVAEYSKGKRSEVLVEQGEKSAAIEAKFVDIVKGFYPDAEPYMGDGNPVVWKVGGKTVAVIMPRKEGTFPDLLTEWLEENRKPQPETPKGKRPKKRSAAGGQADVGGYASFGDYGSYENEQGARNEPNPVTMDLPELVELARQLMQGNFPKVLKKLRGMAVGRFYPSGQGKITLEAGLFKNTEQAAKTLAHEIGHLVDWLPDKDMSRGNILGRIASLKRYTKHIIWPKDSPGPLTEEDKKRLRAEAESLIAAFQDDKWIDEEIERVLPITPEDVLAIWNSMDFDKVLNKELYEYIANLSAAEKKSIVKEALRGETPTRLRTFAHKIKEKTGRKIKVPGTAPLEAVRMKYEKLLEEEIRKRHIFNMRDIMEELKRFTQKWKPFNPRQNIRFTKYRFSGTELYADALSALLTNPYFLKTEAPNFYEAFFDFVENKPEVLRLWNQIQADIRLGVTDDKLSHRVLEGFELREDEYRQSLRDRFRRVLSTESWATAFVDRYYALTRRVKKVGESNIPAGLNPRYKIEKLTYSGSEHEGYLNAVENKVLKPLEKEGLSPNELGFYMFMKRVATERAGLANPYGTTKERAEKILAKMDSRVRAALEKARQEFYKIRRESLLNKIAESNPYSPELMKTIEDAEDYATFDIVGHMDGKYGGEASARIYRQVGTFSATGNPFTATVQKDMSLMTAINKNIAAKSVVGFLNTYFSKDISEPKMKWNGKFREMVPSRDENVGLIVYLEGGKLEGKYVPRFIADSFHSNPTEGGLIASAYQAITEVLRTTLSPFRTLFVEANPGFWAFNIQRDYRRLARDLPKANLVNMAKYYVKAFPMSFRRVFGKYDDTIQKILRGNMLISVANYRGELKEDTQLERLMARYHMEPKRFNSKIIRPFERFWYYWSGLARGLETVPKVAGYLYLKDRFPDLHPEEVAHIVRVRSGSPDFMRTGSATGLYNSVFMFSNAMKEGWRGDIEAARGNPAEFAWKVTKYNLLPKMAMMAIGMGLLGWEWKEMMDRATEYDKTNYIIVPLGTTPQGKSVYMRVPQDETGRLIGGTVWKLMNLEKAGAWTNLLDYMAGQAPTLHPLIQVISGTMSYLSGNNPYDSFRGRSAIPDQIFEAGGKRSHKEFGKWISNQSGGGIVYRFGYDDPNQVKTELEKLLGFPIVSNILGRFIKVTDYGKREQLREDKKQVRSIASEEAILAKECAQKLADGEEYTAAEFEAFAKRTEVVDNYALKALASKYGNVYFQEFLSAQSTEEKMAVLNRMLGDYALRKAKN